MRDVAAFRVSRMRCHGVDQSLRYLRGRHAPKKTRLSNGARLAYLEVRNYAHAFFSVPYLAELLEVSESTARGYLAELEQAGLIWRHDNTNGVGGCSSNTYELIFDEATKESRGTGAEVRWHKRRDHKPRISEAADNPFAEVDEELAPTDSPPAPEAHSAPNEAPQEVEVCAKEGDDRDSSPGPRPPAESPPLVSAAPHRLPLRDCRSPLLDFESNAALLSMPEGRRAARLLEQSGLSPQQCKYIVDRAIEVDQGASGPIRGSIGFVKNLIKEVREEGLDRQERIAESRVHRPYVAPQRPDDDAVISIRANIRRPSKEQVEAAIEQQKPAIQAVLRAALGG